MKLLDNLLPKKNDAPFFYHHNNNKKKNCLELSDSTPHTNKKNGGTQGFPNRLFYDPRYGTPRKRKTKWWFFPMLFILKYGVCVCIYIYIHVFHNNGGKKTGKSSRYYVINGIYILNLATKTLKNQQFYFWGEGIKKKSQY